MPAADRVREAVAILSDPSSSSLLLVLVATIAMMAGGLALMLAPSRRFAVRLLGLGVFLAAVGALAPAAFAGANRFSGFVPAWVLFWIGIAGSGAIILGAVRIGLSLVSPAAMRFIVAPLLEPALGASSGSLADALTGLILLIAAGFFLRLTVRVAVGSDRTVDGAGGGRHVIGLVGLALRLIRHHGS